MTLLYQAMAMFVGTSLTMAFDALIGNYLIALPTSLAIGGVLLLLVPACSSRARPRTPCGAIDWRSSSIRSLRQRRTARGEPEIADVGR